MKLEFSPQIFKKLKYQVQSKSIHWEPSCSTRTDGQTADGQDEANSRFSQFFESA
jgi:hypothetical protein